MFVETARINSKFTTELSSGRQVLQQTYGPPGRRENGVSKTALLATGIASTPDPDSEIISVGESSDTFLRNQRQLAQRQLYYVLYSNGYFQI